MAKAKSPSKSVAKHPGGRPSAYRDEYAEQGQKMCLLGATDKEMADFFDVAESTVYL